MKKLKKYCFNILLSIDQFLNVLLGGDPDETISSRAAKLEYKEKSARVFCKILSFFLGKDHCQKSLEPDEGKDNILK
jgi:hypothetical protein